MINVPRPGCPIHPDRPALPVHEAPADTEGTVPAIAERIDDVPDRGVLAQSLQRPLDGEARDRRDLADEIAPDDALGVGRAGGAQPLDQAGRLPPVVRLEIAEPARFLGLFWLLRASSVVRPPSTSTATQSSRRARTVADPRGVRLAQPRRAPRRSPTWPRSGSCRGRARAATRGHRSARRRRRPRCRTAARS